MRNAFQILNLSTAALNVRVEKTNDRPRVFMYYKLQHQITIDVMLYWREKPIIQNGQEWDEETSQFSDIKEGIY